MTAAPPEGRLVDVMRNSAKPFDPGTKKTGHAARQPRLMGFRITTAGMALFRKVVVMSNAETLGTAEMTVDEALAAQAAELKAKIAWARNRLDRAASIVALVTEPDDPNGSAWSVWYRADALALAEALQEDVWNRLGEGDYFPLAAHLHHALDRHMSALSEAEGNRWEEDVVRRMTVAELAAALKEEPAAATAAQPSV